MEGAHWVVFVAAVFGVLPVFLLLAMVLCWRRWFDQDRNRRLPFEDIPKGRLPGLGLRLKLREVEERRDDLMLKLSLLGPGTLAAWAMQKLYRAGHLSVVGIDWLWLFFLWAFSAFAAWKYIGVMLERRRLREGLRAESAVAQYLLPLVQQGWDVFHDLPCERFNIDHVAIGPNGVFAIETKSRKKPPKEVKNGHRARFDGSAVHFPDHSDKAMVDQMRRQAQWLARELTSGRGEPIKVFPVLLLPGWYVETEKWLSPAEGCVLAGKGIDRILPKIRTNVALSREEQTRIAHVLSLRYPANPDVLA